MASMVSATESSESEGLTDTVASTPGPDVQSELDDSTGEGAGDTSSTPQDTGSSDPGPAVPAPTPSVQSLGTSDAPQSDRSHHKKDSDQRQGDKSGDQKWDQGKKDKSDKGGDKDQRDKGDWGDKDKKDQDDKKDKRDKGDKDKKDNKDKRDKKDKKDKRDKKTKKDKKHDKCEGPADHEGDDVALAFAHDTSQKGPRHGDHDCDEPKTPGVSVYVEQCEWHDGEPASSVGVMLSDLQKHKTYYVKVSLNGEVIASEKIVAESSSAELTMPTMGTGSYTATVTAKKSGLSSSADFEVMPCPAPPSDLGIAGEGEQCVAKGGVGTVLVTISGLQPDDVYSTELWFGHEIVGHKILEYPESSSHTYTFQVKAFGEYTAYVTGGMDIEPSVEYTVASEEEWTPQPSAMVVFEAGEGCAEPAPPAKKPPTSPTPPALVSAGSAGEPSNAGLLFGAGFMLTMGGALVLARKLQVLPRKEA